MTKEKKQAEIEQFKNGIFALRTNFGELAQLMIMKRYHLQKSTSKDYDLVELDEMEHIIPVEVKFARAYKNPTSINESNVLYICSNCSVDIYSSNAPDQTDLFCNIQQIKPDLFKKLYYGIFWSDKVEIFCIDENKHHLFPDSLSHFTTDEVYRKEIRKKIPYFYLQHNKKDYQFHLKKKSLTTHRRDFSKESLTYEQLFDLFSAKECVFFH